MRQTGGFRKNGEPRGPRLGPQGPRDCQSLSVESYPRTGKRANRSSRQIVPGVTRIVGHSLRLRRSTRGTPQLAPPLRPLRASCFQSPKLLSHLRLGQSATTAFQGLEALRHRGHRATLRSGTASGRGWGTVGIPRLGMTEAICSPSGFHPVHGSNRRCTVDVQQGLCFVQSGEESRVAGVGAALGETPEIRV
jgi:hypothetical protein